MPPSLELQGQFSVVEPRDGLRHSLPGNVSEDRVAKADLDGLDILVNNAGVNVHKTIPSIKWVIQSHWGYCKDRITTSAIPLHLKLSIPFTLPYQSSEKLLLKGSGS